MIDIKTQLVEDLKIAGLPVFYELLYKPGTLPAITYVEVDNADLYNGDRRNYSTLRYEIKVWGRSLQETIDTAIAVDSALKTSGWSRYAAIEINSNSAYVKVLRYIATGYDEV